MANVEYLLPLAQEFLIGRLTEYCDAAMALDTPSLRNLELADVYDLPKTRTICLTELAKNPCFKKLTWDGGYNSLRDKSKIGLLQKRVEILETEYFLLRRDSISKKCSHQRFSMNSDLNKLDTQCENCMFRVLEQSVSFHEDHLFDPFDRVNTYSFFIRRRVKPDIL